MEELNNENKGEVGGSEDSGEGDKPEETKIIEQQSKRIKELEDERHKRIIEDAKKQMGGVTEGGKSEKEVKSETPHEYRLRIDKELAQGKTDFGN